MLEPIFLFDLNLEKLYDNIVKYEFKNGLKILRLSSYLKLFSLLRGKLWGCFVEHILAGENGLLYNVRRRKD